MCERESDSVCVCVCVCLCVCVCVCVYVCVCVMSVLMSYTSFTGLKCLSLIKVSEKTEVKVCVCQWLKFRKILNMSLTHKLIQIYVFRA